MDITRFKQYIQELKDIALPAATCGFLTGDQRDQAKEALRLVIEMEDDIRSQEIDEFIQKQHDNIP